MSSILLPYPYFVMRLIGLKHMIHLKKKDDKKSNFTYLANTFYENSSKRKQENKLLFVELFAHQYVGGFLYFFRHSSYLTCV